MTQAKLTELQKRFVDEFIIEPIATKAYIKAGYKATGHAAEVNASKLLKKPAIQEYLAQRSKDRSKRTEITQDRVLQELAKIGFANIADYLKVDGTDYQAGTDSEGTPVMRRGKFVDIFESDTIDRTKLDAVAEIRQTKEGIAIKLHDKVSALEKIGRHLGMFNDKLKIEGTVVHDHQHIHNLRQLSAEDLAQMEAILQKVPNNENTDD